MLFVFVDGVFLQYAGSARAVAQAHHSAVDAEIGIPLVFQFVVVGLAGQILGRVGQSAEREGLVDSLDAEPLAFLRLQFYHRTVLVVSRVLRTGVVDVLLADCRFPQANGARHLTVRVVVPRSTAVPRQLLVFAGQFDENAEARQWGQRVGNLKGKDKLVAVLLCRHGDGERVESTAFPVLCQPVAKALVVVCRCAINLRFDGRCKM